MGGVVANEFERAGIVAGEKFDFGVVLDRIGKIGKLAVERHRHRALGERGRNALGDVEAGCAVGIIPTRAVGKGQRDHHSLLFAHSLRTNAGKHGRTIFGVLQRSKAGPELVPRQRP